MTDDLTSAQHIALTERRAAHNYHPLPVVLAHGEGSWVTDVEGTRYLDCLAGYSALNFGHRHPRLVARAEEQLGRLTLTSRAFYNDQLGPFAEALGALVGKETILPMNTGAEAVETALKVARKWGAEVKGVAPGRGRIVVMEGNFHGRTTTIVGFSTDDLARQGFGPYTPGFDLVPYGDAAAVEAAVTIRDTPTGRCRISAASSAVAAPCPCHLSRTVTARSALVGSSWYRMIRATATMDSGPSSGSRMRSRAMWSTPSTSSTR